MLGTAGAVIAALNELPDEFFVLYGDTMVNVDLEECSARMQRVAQKARCSFIPTNTRRIPTWWSATSTGALGPFMGIHIRRVRSCPTW